MNVNNLLEGASPYQVQQNEAAKLSSKWGKSGLLEGIQSSTEANNMAMLLENQAKQLVNEANSSGGSANFAGTGAGSGEAWAGVALPLVRRVFGEIVAKDLVSVQPMNLPAGLIFYLDFQYGDSRNGQAAGESLYGATADLKRTDGEFNKGLYGAGEFGYSIHEKTAEVAAIGTTAAALTSYATGSALELEILNGDSDFASKYSTEMAANLIKTIKVAKAFKSDADLEGVRAFKIDDANGHIDAYFPQFTRVVGDNIEFVAQVGVITEWPLLGALTVSYHAGPDNINESGDFEDKAANATQGDGFTNSSLEIPSIDVKLQSDTVAAKTRKLKAQWTPEFAQDLNAYHSIDAEAELTSILSEYISMEIDLEILDMLIRNADTVEAWSAKIAVDATVSSNNTAGGTTAITQTSPAADGTGVYYTKMSWFQTLGIKLQKVSNLIHQKTLRGGANFMVISPKVSTILESIPGFAADSSGDDGKYAMGVQKIGAINSRYTVYKNPYMTENVILMGYKGSQFLETGAVFAPYIPLIMTPLVYDPTSFTPRKGIMTRYAKKMVRPDFYGKVLVQDLNEL